MNQYLACDSTVDNILFIWIYWIIQNLFFEEKLMFTGLIEDVGEMCSVERKGKSGRVSVRTCLDVSSIKVGDSISVNGACLTVEKCEKGMIHFHCLAETLARTNLGKIPHGSKLNLEQAMMLGGRMGGHIVTGHVDFCSKVISAGMNGDDFELVIEIPEEQSEFFVMKGSVAINGVSLTIAGLESGSLKVCLIPVTKAKTNLEALRPGDFVNVESDILGKYVLGAFKKQGKNARNEGITMSTLLNAGF